MGYLDSLANTNLYDDVVMRAFGEAKRLGGYVTQPAFARQKMLERGELYGRVLADLKKINYKIQLLGSNVWKNY